MTEARPKILIVDDGDRYAELAHALLRGYDYATRCELRGPCWQCPHRSGCVLTHAHDWAEVEQALARHADIDVVLLDVAFELPVERLLPIDGLGADETRRRQGLAILRALRATRASLPVVLMTSREEVALTGSAAALDADEWLTLAGADAFDARALGLLVERVLARRHRVAEGDDYTWGASPAMERLRRDATALARTSLPLLVLGEPGTGKSALVERVIHEESGRAGPFLSVDLSALPSELVASELFGSARGAFSGAVDRMGRFERANGGTLLLDEIGNLGPEAQRMLLLVLQERRVTRLGESTARPIDVKVVAATNRDLERAVREGRFRADLYARLNPAAKLVVPPLRERLVDLPALLGRFVTRTFERGAERGLVDAYASEAGLPRSPSPRLAIGRTDGRDDGLLFALSDAGRRALLAHPWPGNVRELELFAATACSMTLEDARAGLARRPSAADARMLPIPLRLVRELLGGSWIPTGAIGSGAHDDVAPQESLHAVAMSLERAHFERLFAEANGDFEAMAARLLRGDPASNARKVQLRLNQLGLSAKRLRRSL